MSDELICQRVYTHLSEHGLADEDNIVKGYFKGCPLPSRVVYFYDEPENILNKILKRKHETGRINYMHKNLDNDQLLKRCSLYQKYAEFGVRVLENRGVRVIRIDASKENNSKLLQKNELIK